MKSKPCIAEVITRLVRGGAQEGTLLITERLLREGYSVLLVYGPGDISMLDRLPKDNPDLTRVPIPEFRRRILPVWDFLALIRLTGVFLKYRPDLVHTHTSKAGILGRWAAKLAGVPVIIHSPRGSIYHETYFKETVLKLFAFLERWTAKFTEMIATLCESEKQDYVRYGIAPPEKFTTIYSGTEIKRYTQVRGDVEEKKRKLGIPPNCPVIGYVARMTPEKGHRLCLKAFQRVLGEFPNAVLVLVGGGPLETEVMGCVGQWNLEDKVMILGARKDVPEILRTFDCFIQTSLWDGLPRAMVEAMLAERPVVATSVGGIPEVIHHRKTGLLVQEKNAEELASGVIEILRDPILAQELGKNARKRMEEVFDIDASVDKLFSLYESLLKKRTGAA